MLHQQDSAEVLNIWREQHKHISKLEIVSNVHHFETHQLRVNL